MKKIISVLVSLTITVLSMTCIAFANENKTLFYLDYGDVIIGENSVSGYGANGKIIENTNNNGYIVTQRDSSTVLNSCVKITDGNISLELLNINILGKGSFDYAVGILGTASAMITVSGENHIKGGLYRAGIDVAQSAAVNISGDGVLYASSEFEAGIGGGNGKNNGTVTINSGTIYATGGISGYSAGIGGGTAGNGGVITINGGNITAVGGERAAGIGGGNMKDGGIITINGGCITAIGGYTAAGIGGGYLGNGGTVIINSFASVKATAGEGADDIGNGQNCKTDFDGIKNSDLSDVYLVKLQSGDFSKCYMDGLDSEPILVGHDGDDSLYFYLDNGKHIVTLFDNAGNAKYYSINSKNIEEIFPIDLTGTKTYKDYLIIDSDNIDVADGYTVKKSDDELELYCGDILLNSFKVILAGDVNVDGVVNSTDALIVLNVVIDKTKPDEMQSVLCDMNSDGNISSYDALLILYKTVA